MNFSQITKRFHELDLMAGLQAHKFKPGVRKVDGLKQHIYRQEV